jgi:hypothetical protein
MGTDRLIRWLVEGSQLLAHRGPRAKIRSRDTNVTDNISYIYIYTYILNGTFPKIHEGANQTLTEPPNCTCASRYRMPGRIVIRANLPNVIIVPTQNTQRNELVAYHKSGPERFSMGPRIPMEIKGSDHLWN